MNILESIQTFRNSEASEAAIYAGDGMSFATVRAKRAADPVYRRKLAGVMHFMESIRNGRTEMYELREMLQGTRHLTALNETLSTSDFSYLFGDVIDRQLLAQYATTEPSWKSWCLSATVPDFRTVKRFTLDGLRSPLSVVPQEKNYPASKLDDGAYSYAVQKYGRTIPLAWETIVNDDLNAFQRIPQLLSEAAINTEEYFATSLICNSSGFLTSVFSTTYKNTVTTAYGAQSNHPAFSVAGLQDALTVLMSQTDPDGTPIAIRGVTVMVPPTLALLAQSVITNIMTVRIGAASTSAQGTQLAYSVPEWLKNLKVVTGYFLPVINTTAGNTTWYVFADPNIGRPALELGHLRGHEAPELFRKMPNAMRMGGAMDPMDGSWDDDSVGYKLRIVLGGTVIDRKGVVVSRGDGQA